MRSHPSSASLYGLYRADRSVPSSVRTNFTSALAASSPTNSDEAVRAALQIVADNPDDFVRKGPLISDPRFEICLRIEKGSQFSSSVLNHCKDKDLVERFRRRTGITSIEPFRNSTFENAVATIRVLRETFESYLPVGNPIGVVFVTSFSEAAEYLSRPIEKLIDLLGLIGWSRERFAVAVTYGGAALSLFKPTILDAHGYLQFQPTRRRDICGRTKPVSGGKGLSEAVHENRHVPCLTAEPRELQSIPASWT